MSDSASSASSSGSGSSSAVVSGASQLNSAKRNNNILLCPYCDSKFLLQDVGEYSNDREIFLHHIEKKESNNSTTGSGSGHSSAAIGEVLKEFYIIRDRFQFENIGVSRPVPSSASAAAAADNVSSASSASPSAAPGNALLHPSHAEEFRYLTCADCERGPFGIVFSKQPECFYLAISRVKPKV